MFHGEIGLERGTAAYLSGKHGRPQAAPATGSLLGLSRSSPRRSVCSQSRPRVWGEGCVRPRPRPSSLRPPVRRVSLGLGSLPTHTTTLPGRRGAAGGVISTEQRPRPVLPASLPWVASSDTRFPATGELLARLSPKSLSRPLSEGPRSRAHVASAAPLSPPSPTPSLSPLTPPAHARVCCPGNGPGRTRRATVCPCVRDEETGTDG